jgi:DNA-binding transcriptional LysR family regulator
MHIPWDAVELFLAAAEQRTLNKAARALGVTQPTVSRRLADLETLVGEPLFTRSVDGVSLTPAGERLLEPARRMADGHGELERVASGVGADPRGVVRVTAPPGIAHELLAPFAVALREEMPAVSLEVLSTVRYLDLVRRDADLAVRASKPPTRDLVCLASIEEPVAAFASPEYARRLPPSPTLAEIGWIGWPATHAELPPNPQLAARIPDFVPAFASDDFLVQLRAAERGAGAIVLSRRTSRLAGPSSLVELPVPLGPLKTGMHLVCAKSALSIARVKAVADRLAAELSEGARVARDVSKAAPPPAQERMGRGGSTRPRRP